MEQEIRRWAFLFSSSVVLSSRSNFGIEWLKIPYNIYGVISAYQGICRSPQKHITEQQTVTKREPKMHVSNCTLVLPVVGYKNWRKFGGQ